ncbi:hypothetical protein HDU87_008819 [Geranomyces variabilis]|uniref:Uncharacterized protein n=1 Tax=Geranomyces variabilis TaxID=109894 RepID=A0AAD5TEU1_9FUNG|nr:hypothetical protein HDU87_008819 [Geranomyces variabilis]
MVIARDMNNHQRLLAISLPQLLAAGQDLINALEVDLHRCQQGFDVGQFPGALNYLRRYSSAREDKDYSANKWELIGSRESGYGFTNRATSFSAKLQQKSTKWLDLFFINNDPKRELRQKVSDFVNCEGETDPQRLETLRTTLYEHANYVESCCAGIDDEAKNLQQHDHTKILDAENVSAGFRAFPMSLYDQYIISKISCAKPANDKHSEATSIRKAMLFATCLNAEGKNDKKACWFLPYSGGNFYKEIYEKFQEPPEVNIYNGVGGAPTWTNGALLEVPQVHRTGSAQYKIYEYWPFSDRSLWAHDLVSVLVDDNNTPTPIGHHPLLCERNQYAYWSETGQPPRHRCFRPSHLHRISHSFNLQYCIYLQNAEPLPINYVAEDPADLVYCMKQLMRKYAASNKKRVPDYADHLVAAAAALVAATDEAPGSDSAIPPVTPDTPFGVAASHGDGHDYTQNVRCGSPFDKHRLVLPASLQSEMQKISTQSRPSEKGLAISSPEQANAVAASSNDAPTPSPAAPRAVASSAAPSAGRSLRPPVDRVPGFKPSTRNQQA